MLMIRNLYFGSETAGFAASQVSISNTEIFQEVHFTPSIAGQLMKATVLVQTYSPAPENSQPSLSLGLIRYNVI